MTIYGFIMADTNPEILPCEKMCKARIYSSKTQRDSDAYDLYTETYDTLDEIGVIDTDYTPDKYAIVEFLKKIGNDEPVVIQCEEHHVNFEFFEKNITTA